MLQSREGYDNDGDLDLVLAGGDSGVAPITRLYRNDGGFAPNGPPSAPTGVSAIRAAGRLVLLWEPATDPETPSPGLSYNVRIGSTPTATDSYPSMAGASGSRHVARIGPVTHVPGLVSAVVALPAGTYFASVQAIDASLQGGPWSDSVAFTLP